MNRLCRRGTVSIGIALITALLSTVSRADSPEAPQKVTTVEGITEYRLSNGLRLLLFPDSSTSKVTVNLTVFVGSRQEGYGETGMAHLLEHMVFKGTPTHKDVPKALRDHGADFNGSTWVDRTNYHETMEGTDENLEFALRLEADRLVNSFIKREDLASEMTVVRSEFEAGENNPVGILLQRMRAVAYEWHNYGKSTIGNRSDIERVPIDKLQTFYRKHYQPDKALQYGSKYFAGLKRPERELDDTYTEEPPQDGERSVVLRRVGTVGAVGVVYHIPAGPHPDYAPLEVLARMLVQQPSGRLYTALVTSKKATRVSGSADGYHDPGLLEFMAQVDKNASLEAVRDTLLGVLEKLPEEKLTEEEVDRAKRRLLKNFKLSLNDSNQIGIDLSEWAAMGDWRLLFIYRDRLMKVTPADVERVAKAYLKVSNRTVGMFIPSETPQRAKVPATPKVTELVKDYTGGKAVVEGENIDPTPETIEKRLQRSVLPSGVKAALLPKKTRGEQVLVELTLRYGNADSLKGQQGPSQFLASLLARGTTKHNRQQLEDEVDLFDSRLSPSGSLGEVSFSIESNRGTLPKVLAILHEVLRQPSFPADEFEVLKRQSLETLRRSLKEPSALASRALNRALSPYPKDDVRYTPTIEESIARVEATTVEQVKKLYETQLGATVGELVVIGDFDPEATVVQMNKMLADWKSTVPFKRIERPAKTDVKGETIVIETPDKENAYWFGAELLAMKDSDPDDPALEIGNYVLGGSTLSSRLGDRVRQKDGLSYGVASQFSADDQDAHAEFVMYAICNPTNIDKVDKAIKEELDRLLKDGLSEAELEDAKKAYLAEQKVARGDDSQLASVLSSEMYAGRTLAFLADFEKKVAALKVAEVNKALKKNIDPKRLVIIRAGDFQMKDK
jgi:zinc protease